MSTQTRGAVVARPRASGRRDSGQRATLRQRLDRVLARQGTRGMTLWERGGLLAILAISAALNLINLNKEGYANEYYAAGVKSMLTSWHNFFFVAFDPGGFISIDKPPLGFWIQAASAKLFGFSGWSILLPEALAGIAGVGILYALVRRLFGPLAGLTAGLALAVTPISVATNRNNTIDSLLVVAALGAAWAVTKAIESTRHPLRWLTLGGVFIGLGFNIKMFEAYLVLPALWLAYLLVARSGLLARIGHLIAATVAMVAVSLSWAVAVDLTPASERPFVGSSTDNTVFELILGHNGFQRLFGRGTGSTSLDTLLSSSTQGAGGVGGVSENGAKGIFRILDTQLGGQIGWLVPLAVIGIIAAAWTLRPRNLRRWRTLASTTGAGLLRRRRTALVIWSGWFVTMTAFFSVAGFFHRYYLTMLAPAVAALVGIGVATLWRAWGRRGRDSWLGWLLPLALVGNAVVQAKILADYTAWNRLTPAILALSIAAAMVLVALRLLRHRAATKGRRIGTIARIALGTALLALILAPSVWSGITVQAAGNGQASSLPYAGPTSGGGMGGMGGGMGQPTGNAQGGAQRGTPPEGMAAPEGMTPPSGTTGSTGTTTGQTARTTTGTATNEGTAANAEAATANRGGGGMGGGISTNLLNWLIANQGGARYIVGVQSANGASSIILQTGLPVMAYGGFEGNDPTLTADSLAQLVANGTIRYIIIGGQGGGQGGSGGTFSVSSWVQQHGTLVSATTWGDSSSSVQLYDLAASK